MPIRVRITLISAALMAVVLAATGLFLFLRLKSDLRRVVDEGLDSRADALVARVDTSGADLGEQGLVQSDEAFAQILGTDGAVIQASPGLKGPLLPEVRLLDLDGARYLDATVAGDEEAIEARLLVVPTDRGAFVVVGASLEHEEEALAALGPLLLVGGPISLALVTAVVWVLTGLALRPVERMRAEAEALSLSEPGHRLPVPGTRDEIARLGVTLNELLGRLEQALDRERRFVDDASHELRTPLAILKTELEIALRNAQTKEELDAALRSAAKESEALSRIAEDLLILARADRGRLPVARSDVDLLELSRHVAEGFRARAADHGVKLEVRGDDGMTLRADPIRVRQALTNLLDNALRHTPTGGDVGVDVRAGGDALLIEVTDTGPGFRPDLLANAFEPFVRDEAPRTRGDGGAGLGLAIVRAVVEAHGGSVAIKNRPGAGASVLLRFPR
jgi:two-component system, OmpR family, sensor kinase